MSRLTLRQQFWRKYEYLASTWSTATWPILSVAAIVGSSLLSPPALEASRRQRRGLPFLSASIPSIRVSRASHLRKTDRSADRNSLCRLPQSKPTPSQTDGQTTRQTTRTSPASA
ncbi:hypothetical protein TgHK011_008524 [Trichoderma gracile]|nr:hypothetical protein TgHK011_008524 [Trichoderma gracile]